MTSAFRLPLIQPLGDRALVVRFFDRLTDEANQLAIGAAHRLQSHGMKGCEEVTANLVSVLVRFDPLQTSFDEMSAEVRVALSQTSNQRGIASEHWTISIRYDGEDLPDVASKLGLSTHDFVERHRGAALRVLATGFAPGFVYLGLHNDDMVVERRATLHPKVPAGTVLFAAGQTAIAATEIPTGWNVIGHTDFQNFYPVADPVTQLAAGDYVSFEMAP